VEKALVVVGVVLVVVMMKKMMHQASKSRSGIDRLVAILVVLVVVGTLPLVLV